MHLEKYLESIVKNYDLDETYRYVANFAFSARLTYTTEQPGAIKVGDLNDEARNNFLNIIKNDINIKENIDIINFANDFSHNVGYGKMFNLNLKKYYSGYNENQILDLNRYNILLDRYHIILKNENQNIHTFDEGSFDLKQGEMWWYNIKMHYSNHNVFENEKIHLIIDVLPYKNYDLFKLIESYN